MGHAEEIEQSLTEALEHARGERELASTVAPDLDVAAIRIGLQLTQADFAERYGFNLATLRQWERGRRRPTGAARVLLMVLAREPDAVRRALAR